MMEETKYFQAMNIAGRTSQAKRRMTSVEFSERSAVSRLSTVHLMCGQSSGRLRVVLQGHRCLHSGPHFALIVR